MEIYFVFVGFISKGFCCWLHVLWTFMTALPWFDNSNSLSRRQTCKFTPKPTWMHTLQHKHTHAQLNEPHTRTHTHAQPHDKNMILSSCSSHALSFPVCSSIICMLLFFLWRSCVSEAWITSKCNLQSCEWAGLYCSGSVASSLWTRFHQLPPVSHIDKVKLGYETFHSASQFVFAATQKRIRTAGQASLFQRWEPLCHLHVHAWRLLWWAPHAELFDTLCRKQDGGQFCRTWSWRSFIKFFSDPV